MEHESGAVLPGAVTEELLDAVIEQLGQGEDVVPVTAPSASGREVVLDGLEERLDGAVERINLRDHEKLPGLPADGIVIVEDCQVLYERRIDGFDALDAFIRELMGSGASVVMGWNKYAWQYVSQVHGISTVAGGAIEVPALSSEEVRALLEEQGALTGIEVVDDRDRSSRLLDIEWRDVSVGGSERRLPVPRIDTSVLRSSRGEDEGAEEAVMRRVREVSGGIAGVVGPVWERAIRDGNVAYGELEAVPVGKEVDDLTARVLYTLLTNERITADHLARLIDADGVDRVLYRLERDAVVCSGQEGLTIHPLALPAVVDVLDRRRLLW